MQRFEALVAKVAGAFLANHDPARERCWIAERNGVNIGSVFMVRESDEIAQAAPADHGTRRPRPRHRPAPGRGVHRLSPANAGYRRVILWTNDVLIAARSIYRACGFRLVASTPQSDYGPSIVSEDWELLLH